MTIKLFEFLPSHPTSPFFPSSPSRETGREEGDVPSTCAPER